jgi:hypothetical protein
MADDLPPGFTLDEPGADLPPGFALDEAKPTTRLQRFATGVGDVIQGGAQLAANALPAGVVDAVNGATAYVNDLPVVGPVTRALGMTPATPTQINQQTAQRESEYQASRRAGGETGTDWMRMAGNVVGGLPLAAALPVGATIPGAIVAGAASGAAGAALEPVTQPDYWGGKQNQLMTGGAIGAGLGPAGLVAGRLIAPRISPNVRTLSDAGVEMTPGQIIGGAARTVEDAATSVPVLGEQVKRAQRNSIETFNRASSNEALAPIRETVSAATPAGREMVQETGDRISAAYDRAYSQARPFGPDAQFANDIQQLGQQFLTPTARNTFAAALQNDVISRIQAAGGQIDADTFRAIKTELGNRARQYGRSQEPDNQELSEAFGGVLQAMHGLMARSNPQTAPLLREADAAFARNVRVEGAAGRVGAVDGVFTPAQFAGSVRQADNSVRKGGFARGNALMQDLSDAARDVLPNKLPESGTTPRLLQAALLGGTATGYINPWAAAGGAALYGAYTDPARRAIAATLLARRPTAINELGEVIAGSGGPVAGPASAEYRRNRLLQD